MRPRRSREGPSAPLPAAVGTAGCPLQVPAGLPRALLRLEGRQQVAAWMLELCREQRCHEEMVVPLALNYADRCLPSVPTCGKLLQLLGASCLLLASRRRETGPFSPEQQRAYTAISLVPEHLRGWIRFVLQQQGQRGRVSSAPKACLALETEPLPTSQPCGEKCPQAPLVPLGAPEHPLAPDGTSVIAACRATRPFCGLATSWDLVPGQDLTAVRATAGQTKAGKGGDASFATRPAGRFPLALQGARPKQRELNWGQKAGRTGRRSTRREGGEGMGWYPLSYQTLDRAQLHHLRLREPPPKPQGVREEQPPCTPQQVGEAEGDSEQVEVMGVWKSRNRRLNLMDILKAGPKGTWSSELQSQVIWETVQDAAGNFDLAKLQEAIAEVHEDLKKLTAAKKAGLRKEELTAGLSGFHYYPDEPTLQLTLEQLQVQRKMVLWGMAPRGRHQEQGPPRQAAGRRGWGAPPPPPCCPRCLRSVALARCPHCRRSLALAREKQRGGSQGPPAGRKWLSALRRYCCWSCSQGEEGEEEEEGGKRVRFRL
ncbi:hypothetical protein JRQ81_009607 [Phrynocephalus forsythii]|uniref:Cyclin-like domain-containing protein n=1 Tax=Phrynocephalus forsythii TaxID=171643 RepID=A0A9Q1ASF2_9SAUR|nr:hypothetical protein JRQ81_009607 [Phrynocephalus forsythii]